MRLLEKANDKNMCIKNNKLKLSGQNKKIISLNFKNGNFSQNILFYFIIKTKILKI